MPRIIWDVEILQLAALTVLNAIGLLGSVMFLIRMGEYWCEINQSINQA